MNKHVVYLLVAVALGIALRFVVGLEPVWWLAWVVPGAMVALALRVGTWASRGYVALAAAIGVTASLQYFLKVMPPVAVAIVLTLQVLLWMLIIGGTRRIVLAFDSTWTVLALPVIGVAVDTVLAHFTPDGNWGSLAYTQADVLHIAQLASVLGQGGILFLLLLVNSAVAVMLHFGPRRHGVPTACAVTALSVALAWGFGAWRLQAPAAGEPTIFGIASIDDFVADGASGKSQAVWQRYRAQIASLAQGGARVVLLPEKIAVLPRAQATELERALADIARHDRVWLVAGLGVDTGTERRNEAWWFAPDGRLATNYLKHFMAPPEREFVAGHEFPVNEIEGVRYGVAICKDMHFASLGRGFGAREAAVMLVPAWDFDDDARMAANMTKMRGVENGYAVVRASRDGLLSVSDAYGRMLSVTNSSSLPGASLLASAPVGARVTTLYTRIGDLLGWLCVAALAVLIGVTVARRRKRPA